MSKEAEQAVFDKVAQHCIKQGVQASMTDGLGCVYRDERGRKCAVGCLLTTSELRKLSRLNLKGETIAKLPVSFVTDLQMRLGLSAETELLSALQTCHDKHLDEGIRSYTLAMVGVAKHFGLSTEVLLAAHEAKVGSPFRPSNWEEANA